jgi:hypothetical protein
MTYSLRFTAWYLGAVLLSAAQGPAPVIQNGRVEARQATSVEGALRVVPPSADPVWVAWREPMVDGGRQACSTWSDGETTVRGMVLDPQPGRDGRAQIAASADPVQLEAGTGVVVLLRIVDGKIERLHAIADDCPIDANGRTVEWVTGISPAESIRFLATLTQPNTIRTDTRRLALSAITASAMHRDTAANATLDRLMAAEVDSEVRDSAARSLAIFRGRHGFDQVSRAVTGEPDAARRRRLVNALAQSPEPAAAETLLGLARTDANASVRADALYAYAVRAGAAGITQVVDIAARDASPDVQRRAVDGVARLPQHAGVPALLMLARTHANPTIRKQAVTALSRSDDARALAYMEEIVAGGRN